MEEKKARNGRKESKELKKRKRNGRKNKEWKKKNKKWKKKTRNGRNKKKTSTNFSCFSACLIISQQERILQITGAVYLIAHQGQKVK